MNEDKCREELKPFKREVRYVVVKINDIKAAGCTQGEIDAFNVVCDKAAISRLADGKPSLECVVVEHDWPEYEIVWKMIRDRMEGNARQESKAPTLDQVAEIVDNSSERSKGDHWNYVVAKAIHAALPSQEDIDNLKLDRDQWNQAYRMEHLIAEQLRSELASKDRIKLIEGNKLKALMITRLQSDLARKDDKIKRLENEVDVLRRFGNKDCTAIADAEIADDSESESARRC